MDSAVSRKITPERAVIVLFIFILAGLGYFIYTQSKQIENLNTDKLATAEEKTALVEALTAASSTVAMLEERLIKLGENLEELEDDYRDERNRNEEFEDQIRDINKTVGVLDKLSKTDKELLQKYSKVYFLNEHYVPESLSTITPTYTYNEDREYEIHAKVKPYLEEMTKDALDDGIELWVVSAYRSFQTQAQLKGQYLVTYGSGANAFSADQGFSEHQLGTTIDFTTRGLNGGLDGFDATPAFAWLEENAHRYGFTLSYPDGNNYYVYEPWHWRFVGEKLARDLERDNAHFYDWEQRKIDGYLVNIFD